MILELEMMVSLSHKCVMPLSVCNHVDIVVVNSIPAGYYDDDGDDYDDLVSFTFTGPDYQSALNGVTLSSIFQVPSYLWCH